MEITYTILDGNCEGYTANQIKAYADAVKTQLTERFPDADIDVNVKWNVSGVGGGASVYVDEDDDANEFDIQSEVESLADYVWNRQEFCK